MIEERKSGVDAVPCNLADVDVDAALGHVADATLRVRGLVHVEVVNVWGVVCHLKVPNHAVTL